MSDYRLDSSYRRPGGGRVIVAGSPLRLFRVSAGGARVMEAIERGEPPPPGHEQLTGRLIEAGALHPVHAPATSGSGDPFSLADITVVVPAFGAYPDVPLGCEVIVVDDASNPPLVAAPGHRVLRHQRNLGPGPARNTGLAQVRTPLVAFVDTDVAAADPDTWLTPLLGHFADPRVALVAPRVASDPTAPGLLARYEAARSPLDLGREPARVAVGTRVGYVPAAALVCRTEAVRALGGFDPSLRFGEDVDLVWRLAEAGWQCRYEPAGEVQHRPRTRLGEWCRQRIAYGSSAAPLAQRHPGSLAPIRISGWSAVVWVLVALRRPFAALAVAAGTSIALQRKLTDLPRNETLRLAGLGHLYAGRQVASAITRAWWPLALVAAVVSRRGRTAVCAAALVPPIIDWVAQRGPGDPVTYTALRIADDLAYGAGVWRGVIEQRSIEPLMPSLTNWPRRGDG